MLLTSTFASAPKYLSMKRFPTANPKLEFAAPAHVFHRGATCAVPTSAYN